MGQGEKKSLYKETIMTNFSTVIRRTYCVKAKIENPALSDVHGRSVEQCVIKFEDLKNVHSPDCTCMFKGLSLKNKWRLRS